MSKIIKRIFELCILYQFIVIVLLCYIFYYRILKSSIIIKISC